MRSELPTCEIVFSSSFWQLLGIYIDVPVELFWSLKEKKNRPFHLSQNPTLIVSFAIPGADTGRGDGKRGHLHASSRW